MNRDLPNNRLNKRERLTVTMPTKLVVQIDAQVGSEFIDRDDFMQAASKHYIDYLQQDEDS